MLFLPLLGVAAEETLDVGVLAQAVEALGLVDEGEDRLPRL